LHPLVLEVPLAPIVRGLTVDDPSVTTIEMRFNATVGDIVLGDDWHAALGDDWLLWFPWLHRWSLDRRGIRVERENGTVGRIAGVLSRGRWNLLLETCFESLGRL
jgi:hypothetical protein